MCVWGAGKVLQGGGWREGGGGGYRGGAEGGGGGWVGGTERGLKVGGGCRVCGVAGRVEGQGAGRG